MWILCLDKRRHSSLIQSNFDGPTTSGLPMVCLDWSDSLRRKRVHVFPDMVFNHIIVTCAKNMLCIKATVLYLEINHYVNNDQVCFVYLGQCKARPFNFHGVCFFLVSFSAPTHNAFSTLTAEPCILSRASLNHIQPTGLWSNDNGPHDKSACRFFMYIVYFGFVMPSRQQ